MANDKEPHLQSGPLAIDALSVAKCTCKPTIQMTLYFASSFLQWSRIFLRHSPSCRLPTAGKLSRRTSVSVRFPSWLVAKCFEVHFQSSTAKSGPFRATAQLYVRPVVDSAASRAFGLSLGPSAAEGVTAARIGIPSVHSTDSRAFALLYNIWLKKKRCRWTSEATKRNVQEVCQELLRLEKQNEMSVLDIDFDGYSLFHVSLSLRRLTR
jgi:hypothetical protein